jgi:pyruvyltransferase
LCNFILGYTLLFMKIYYWNQKKNFGDQLGPLLLKKFSHLDSELIKPSEAQLILIGSILEHIPEDWKGVIAGVGKLHESTKLNFPNAKILALRGPLSAKDIKGDFVLGDMGLLADELVPEQDKIYELGIVPHWSDTELEHNPIFTKYHPKIIRVDDDPLKVIKEIGQCKKIVSSSLHGIILADAFNIPRRIEIAPRMLTHPQHEGGIFKWKDYSASIGIKLQIGLTQHIDKNIIINKKHELFDVLEEIANIFS